MSLLYTKNLTKTYRRFEKEPGLIGSVKSLFKRKFVERTAVDGFDLTVEPGEFVGLIGPNGAGKTTLVKMLTGIIAPTSGRISVLGYYPNKDAPAQRQIRVFLKEVNQRNGTTILLTSHLCAVVKGVVNNLHIGYRKGR